MNYINYHYHDLLTGLKNIEIDYERRFCKKPEVVFGIKRGGLIPAVHLSHSYEVPLEVIEWSTRDANIRNKDTLNKLIECLEAGRQCLIVDDIFDSGKTLMEISDNLKEKTEKTPIYVTLVLNTNSELLEQFTKENTLVYSLAIPKKQEDWLIFPWEDSAN